MSNTSQLPPEEEYVRVRLSRTLGVPLEAHDDQSRSSMYDLKILYRDRPAAPVEVTSDVDGQTISTLNSLAKNFNNGLWEAPPLERLWLVQVNRNSRLRHLWHHLESNLGALEKTGIHVFESDTWMHHCHGENVSATAQKLGNLGVESAHSRPAVDGAPRIALTWIQHWDSWDGSGEDITRWANEFLSSPRCEDNIKKLSAPGATEAHLAVFAHMSAVAWSVWRGLLDSSVVPLTRPNLPTPVTHIWIFPAPWGSPWGESALAFDSSTGWRRFETSE